MSASAKPPLPVITITIQQLADGGCYVQSNPPMAELFALADPDARVEAQAAHAYAWVALVAIAEEGGGDLSALAS